MAKYNIRIRSMTIGVKIKDIAMQMRIENPDHDILGKLTPAKVSKAIQDNYIGSERDNFIAEAVEKFVCELEALHRRNPECDPIKERKKQ